jgi:hypothetical protein
LVDRTAAGAAVEEHFGFPPIGVNGLYYQRGWEFGDGNTHRMKFQFQDPAIIERIVRAAGLEPEREGEVTPSWVVEVEAPQWWPKQGFSGNAQTFRFRSRPRLWVHRETGIVYYRSWP